MPEKNNGPVLEPITNFPIDKPEPITSGTKITSNTVRVKLVNGLQSFRVKEANFTNYLPKKGLQPEKTSIVKLIDMNNKTVDADSIPILMFGDRSGERLNNGNLSRPKIDRYEKIFARVGITAIDERIDKSVLKTSINEFMLVTQKGDLARIYYIKETSSETQLIVLLVDPHHLVADNDTNIKRKYNKAKTFDSCMTKCRTY